MPRTLGIIFKTFSKPVNDKYGWVDGNKVGLIFLKDFCWSSKLTTCNDVLLILEGHTNDLPEPKNHFADICINKDIPVVTTRKDVIKFIGRYNTTNEVESDMLAVTWHVNNFIKTIGLLMQEDMPP